MSWEFFIRRPIFGTVLSLVVVMAGLMAFRLLPVSQYPQIAPPTATIAISYPGASAETLMRTVAAPIEDEINGTDNLLYYSSTSSSNGLLTITVTFEPGSDPDLAVINLTNRVKVAEPRLPDEARRLGVVVKNRSNDILMSVSVISKDGSRDSVFLSNYAAVNVVEEIKRRGANYRSHFEGAALTPTALAKHWALCATPKQSFADSGPRVTRVQL
jgi:multidrug efflux pump subunit AcrB